MEAIKKFLEAEKGLFIINKKVDFMWLTLAIVLSVVGFTSNDKYIAIISSIISLAYFGCYAFLLNSKFKKIYIVGTTIVALVLACELIKLY